MFNTFTDWLAAAGGNPFAMGTALSGMIFFMGLLGFVLWQLGEFILTGVQWLSSSITYYYNRHPNGLRKLKKGLRDIYARGYNLNPPSPNLMAAGHLYGMDPQGHTAEEIILTIIDEELTNEES